MPVAVAANRETSSTASPQHERTGHFARGNAGGPGNPFARRVGALRSAMLKAVAPEDMQNLVRVLIDEACNGNVAAARLVLQYVLGKPAEAIDPDRADLDEAKLHLEGSTSPADVQTFLQSMPPNFVNVMAEEVRPIVLQKNYEEAERRAAEEAADRARREAEMTAEEDEWEEAEKAAAARAAEVAPARGATNRVVPAGETPAPQPSANGPAPMGAPSPNGDFLNPPLATAYFDRLLADWARQRDKSPPSGRRVG